MKEPFAIHDLPKVERPREKLISKGVQDLKGEELLAILLRTGTKEKSALDLAREILRKYPRKSFSKSTFLSVL